MVDQHEELERILGMVAGDPALAELEDRAYDAAHLEEEHYAVLLSADAGFDEEAILNLKRHALFCDLCSQEFLRRAATEAEVGFGLEKVETSHRRWFLLTAMIGVASLGLGLVIGVMMGRVPSGDRAPSPFAEAVRGGTGAALGRADAPERLFLEVRSATTRDIHLHIFVVAGPFIEPLHPLPEAREANPVPAGLLPAGGWPDPGGTGPRTLLGVLSASPLPWEMTRLAARLRERISDGDTPQDLERVLDQLRGSVDGRTFLIRLEE